MLLNREPGECLVESGWPRRWPETVRGLLAGQQLLHGLELVSQGDPRLFKLKKPLSAISSIGLGTRSVRYSFHVANSRFRVNE